MHNDSDTCKHVSFESSPGSHQIRVFYMRKPYREDETTRGTACLPLNLVEVTQFMSAWEMGF